MSEIVKRIKEFIDNEGIKVAALEKQLGMSNNSFRKSYNNGGSIGTDKLENFLRQFPHIDANWLLFGKRNEDEKSIKKATEPEESYTKKHHNNEIYKLQLEYIEKLSAEKALLEHENKILREQLEKCKK